jgi:hypothetical protein
VIDAEVLFSSRKCPAKRRKGSIETSEVKRRARRPILSIKKKALGENIALLAANLGIGIL